MSSFYTSKESKLSMTVKIDYNYMSPVIQGMWIQVGMGSSCVNG